MKRLDLRPALLLLAVCSPPGRAPIRAGKLVHTAAGTTSTAQQIWIEGGLIRAVGQNVAAPAGTQVVDLSDCTVLPGLMDAHTHLCLTVATQGGNGLTSCSSVCWLRPCWRPTPGARSWE